MDEDIKSLLSEIDNLIEEVTKKGQTPSSEVLDLFDEISNDLKVIKENKKTKLSQDLIDKLDNLIKITSESGNISTETARDIITAIKGIKINTPAPQVNVSPPKVEVNMPPVKVPEVVVPETKIEFPKEMKVTEPSWLSKILPINFFKEIKNLLVDLKPPRSVDDPVSVRLSDGDKFYRAISGMVSAVTGHVPFTKEDGNDYPALVDKDRHIQTDILSLKESVPTDASKVNASLIFTYDANNNLITIRQTIGMVSYLQTLTYDVDNNLTNISVWSQV
jgi:hypothetical protein